MHTEAITHIPANYKEKEGLTRHPAGSLRELLTISLPLMLSMMSGSFMLFIDRLLLAQYSIEALNASVNASAMGAAILFAFLTTAAISEVFVGQYNGAFQHYKIGKAVWQMIWFSLLSAIILVPAGLFLSSYLFLASPYAHMEAEYFKWLMYFGPISCMSVALSSFYIGRGKVKFVTVAVIIANVINILLDFVLIFGYESIPSMGISGAAIATGISQVILTLMLFIGFMRPKYREIFGTHKWKLHFPMFYKCLQIGIPSSLAHTFEIIAWVVFFQLMTLAGEEYMTVAAICQSIFMLFTFVAEGISKSATAIAANLIGAKQWSLVDKLFKSGVKFYLAAFMVMGLILVIDPAFLIDWFVSGENVNNYQLVREVTIAACFWMWVYFFFDGIHWLVVGILTAAGDTRFILWTGGFSAWGFAILPIYLFVNVLGYQADMAWLITAVYAAIVCFIYLYRFKSEKWQNDFITR